MEANMSRLCSWAVALKLCFVQNNIVHFSLPYNVESNEPARNIDTLGDMVVVGLRKIQTELLALFEVFEFIREKKKCVCFCWMKIMPCTRYYGLFPRFIFSAQRAFSLAIII